jgi:hypothetical protein
MVLVGTMSRTARCETGVRVVEREPQRDAGATVVAGEREPLESEEAHHL